MSRKPVESRGRTIVLCGVACLVSALALGSYLATLTANHLARLDLSDIRIDSLPESGDVAMSRSLLVQVNIVLWLVFAIGAGLSMLGLRLLLTSSKVVNVTTRVEPMPEFLKKTD